MYKLFTRIDKVLMFSGICALAMIAISVLLQIIFRYIFNSPLMWPEEAAQLLLISLLFIAAPIVERRNEHVSMDIIPNLFPKAKRFIYLIYKVFSIVFVFVLLISSIIMFYGVRNITTNAASIPLNWIYTIMIISTVVWILILFYSLLEKKNY
ncbi:TRAP transporter small permease [Virgibacillus sp. W0181]|uniref:TRAP transporter small permease n=1 Tax=Virgibacillus sp. W0181 TaxID=3391581 RepID=UPI003F46DA38